MIVSGVQQSDSVIINMYSILFQILFPFRLLRNVESSSLCYTVGPCWLSILNTAVTHILNVFTCFVFHNKVFNSVILIVLLCPS